MCPVYLLYTALSFWDTLLLYLIYWELFISKGCWISMLSMNTTKRKLRSNFIYSSIKENKIIKSKLRWEIKVFYTENYKILVKGVKKDSTNLSTGMLVLREVLKPQPCAAMLSHQVQGLQIHDPSAPSPTMGWPRSDSELLHLPQKPQESFPHQWGRSRTH